MIHCALHSGRVCPSVKMLTSMSLTYYCSQRAAQRCASQARARAAPDVPALTAAPLFCFETAIKVRERRPVLQATSANSLQQHMSCSRTAM